MVVSMLGNGQQITTITVNRIDRLSLYSPGSITYASDFGLDLWQAEKAAADALTLQVWAGMLA